MSVRRGEHAHLHEPISFGEPDHGMTVYLGRCRSYAVPLLTVVPAPESVCGDKAVLEGQGAHR